MGELNLPKDSFLSKNKLNINVDNLGEMKVLLDDVKAKENALHEAVQSLQQFSLEISFTNE